MDNPQKPPTVLSICTGYGGLEIALQSVFGEISTLAHVEIEAYAIANLIKNMETGRMAPAPIWTDVKTLPLEVFRGKVEILTGGYPCQPFSNAGRRLGEKDPRHLWPHIRRTIDIIRPRMCFFENVEGHITEGLYDVLDELGELGYISTWGIFSAIEVGAPHQRKRVFILAHSKGHGDKRVLPNNDKANEKKYESQKQHKNSSNESDNASSHEGRHPLWGSEPDLGRVVDGCADRLDRLRLLGNGVVPQTAEIAFRTLSKELDNAN